jgi:DNA-binding SARP family transcriptional activator/DNA-binding XRE family transcriptional regulator
MRELGARLRAYREAAGLTQGRLAELAGVSAAAVQDIEQGRTKKPRPASLARLAGALHLSTSQLGELTAIPQPPIQRRPPAEQRPTHGSDAGGRLRVCVLGPVAGSRGGTPIALGSVRQRAVLTLLILHDDVGLSQAWIASALWRDDPPVTAATMVHGYIAGIRRLLGAGECPTETPPHRGGALSWDGTRYRLALSALESDLTEFSNLAELARQAAAGGYAAEACQLYEQALRLWRGEPAADIDLLWGHPAVTELSQRRAALILDYSATAEPAGLHQQVLGHLQSLAGRAPLDERVHARLMIALAATGQQAAALGIYQDLRRRLDEELGIDPGRELADAHLQVLRQQAGPPPAGEPVPANAPTAAQPPVPRQLPICPRHFAGRLRELRVLTGLLDQPGGNPASVVVIAAIGGTAGIGKTALAVHWAHQIAGRFPDGQLYINLRGFDPSGEPVAPGDAIRRFLDALQVPAPRIPADPDAQQDLYRSEVADRRMLIVLDNAYDVDQVRPLLPGGPGCLVVVTSRRQLTGLVAAEGAHPVTLDLLSPAEADELLAQRLGRERLAAEPGVAAELTGLCARLPLALSIAAARAAMQPGLPLATLAGQLRHVGRRLDALDAGDLASVRAVFSWSYDNLGEPGARMFRLLGVHPGPDITAAAAASLAAIPLDQARHALTKLTRASLLAEPAPGRYAFHDLLRAYATELATATDTPADRQAATTRMLDHYLHTAARAALLRNQAKEPVALAPPGPGAVPEQPADDRQALVWFEAEHQVLLAALTLAAESGFDTHAWQLPWAMESFLQPRGHWLEWAATQRTALAAATRLGDTAAQALSGRLLAKACTDLRDNDQALGHFASGLTLYHRLGNRLGEARSHQGLGVLAQRQGRYADALGHAEQALRLCQAIGDKASEAEALNDVGWYHGLLSDYQQARAFCRQALTLSAEAGHRRLEGCVWDSVGYAEHHLGNLAEAAACYQRAVSLFREVGDRFAEAETLTHLGDTRHAAGEQAQAREAWQQALAILDDLQHPHAGQVRDKLRAAASETAAPGSWSPDAGSA